MNADDIHLDAFLTSALERDGQLHAQSALPPMKELPVTIS
jgi:hypothetical protein